MAENLQHEDFGEKIGGAKKDLWKDRGLYVDDLGAMNEREAEKFVKKDNVWKKPDYQAMLDDGVPLGVVYFIKKARDSLGASPQYRYSDKTPELRRARQEEYIETVRQLQAVIEDVRTLDDAMQAYDRFAVLYCRSVGRACMAGDRVSDKPLRSANGGGLAGRDDRRRKPRTQRFCIWINLWAGHFRCPALFFTIRGCLTRQLFLFGGIT